MEAKLWIVFVIVIIVAITGCAAETQPSTAPTIEAKVAATLTALTAVAASSPDIEATIQARVEQTQIALASAGETTVAAPASSPTSIPATATPRATPTPRPTRVPPTPTYLLEILDMRCYEETFGDYGGYAYIEGRVKNVSNDSLENVTAVASWYTSGDIFITSDTALIEYNPILPGQTSPFKTISTLNPAMKNCSLAFKSLFGGQISARER